jgi:tetratricopeptide (TPR) repeat protein
LIVHGRYKLLTLQLLTSLVLCGCQSGPSAPSQRGVVPPGEGSAAASRTQAKSTVAPFPSPEDEQKFFERQKKKIRRGDRKNEFHLQQEAQYKAVVSAAEKSGDKLAILDAMRNLAIFYTDHRRHRDADLVMAKLVPIADQIKGEEAHRVPIYAEAGDCSLRRQKYEQAISFYNKALALITSESELTENRVKLWERIAWAQRCLDKPVLAEQTARKALKVARSSYGRQSGEYRIALTELAIFALDRADQQSFAKYQSELKSIKKTIYHGPFGRQFLRMCTRQCRLKEQGPQEDFLDTQYAVFTPHKHHP